MKRPSVYSRKRRGLDVKMTPMIDVVFLLLVFFLWTASFRVVEYVLPTELSSPARAENAPSDRPLSEWDFDPVIVQVLWPDQQLRWIINETPVNSLAEVRTTLISVARIKSDIPVIIDPAENVPFCHVIDVYDISQIAGFKKVQFAASEEI